jgi:hypothetical protein
MSATLTLRATDVSGQKFARVDSCPPDTSVAELVSGLLGTLQMPSIDADGRPLTYQARLEREGRALLESETVGDAMQEDDEVVLSPSIDAGAGRVGLG